MIKKHPKTFFFCLFLICFSGSFLIYSGLKGIQVRTSSDQYCMSCHVHTHADLSWKQSSHHSNKSGVVVHCVDCHLPPEDQSNYWTEKIKAASRDLHSYYFKDHKQINWEGKRSLKAAKQHTFKQSCIKCHQNLFPLELSKAGEEAHFYTKDNEKIHCINCHLGVGHGKQKIHQANSNFIVPIKKIKTFQEAKAITRFEDFKEQIPETDLTFEMIALSMDTGQNIFMGKTEVSWDEYMAFLRDTESEGRSEQKETDAISGATPPFGDPSQAWGMGKRPAITITWHAAKTYCQWLSMKTGKKYRLPSQKEWLSASDFSISEIKQNKRWIKKLQSKGVDLMQMITYKKNSKAKTALPSQVIENSKGFVHLWGNVKEFCSDSIQIKGQIEHVIMGGSYQSDFNELFSMKEHTQHDDWLITDPQIPKSIWWYSDCCDVGFRVVCEWEEEQKKL